MLKLVWNHKIAKREEIWKGQGEFCIDFSGLRIGKCLFFHNSNHMQKHVLIGTSLLKVKQKVNTELCLSLVNVSGAADGTKLAPAHNDISQNEMFLLRFFFSAFSCQILNIWLLPCAGLIEQRDAQPLLKLIDSIGDWPVASEDWNTTTGRNVSPKHSDWCLLHQLASVQHIHTSFLLKYTHSVRAQLAIFAPSGLLSTCFVGGIKRPAEDSFFLTSSQVWVSGGWCVGREASPQSGLWSRL